MASPNLSEIVTTTLASRTGKLADNLTDNNGFLFKLKKKGRTKTFDGGRTINQELAYADNTNAMWYSGYDVLSTAAQDGITSAEFDIKQMAVAVLISGLEQLQNRGKSEIINLLESRIDIAEKSMKNFISAGLYANGTGSGGKEIGGLQLLVADTATSGTVGGINRATYSFWQNYSRDSSDNSVTLSASTIQSEMNIMYLNLARGTDHPDLIIADNTLYRYYLESLQTIQRIQSDEMASAGFDSLKYMGADVIYDGGIQGNCPANHMYFLNCDYIHYRPHSDRNMVAIGGDRMNTNQDAIVKLIGWAGNMTLSNAMLQGVLKV